MTKTNDSKAKIEFFLPRFHYNEAQNCLFSTYAKKVRENSNERDTRIMDLNRAEARLCFELQKIAKSICKQCAKIYIKIPLCGKRERADVLRCVYSVQCKVFIVLIDDSLTCIFGCCNKFSIFNIHSTLSYRWRRCFCFTFQIYITYV